MTIEQKKLSDTEFLLFFPRPFPFRGTFYLTSETASVPIPAKTALPETNTSSFLHTKYHNDISPLPRTATDDTAESNPAFLTELAVSGLAAELLLTESFIYLRSIGSGTTEDLEALALAEINDYTPATASIITADENHTEAKIKIILKTIIAPFLQKDGGDIEFLSFKDGTAVVRFLGKCHGCPYAQRTLKERVEKNLIRWLPQVREVILQ